MQQPRTLTLRPLGLDAFLILEDGPVKDIIVLETLPNKEIAEKLSQVPIIRLIVETERAHVVQVSSELLRETFAQLLHGSAHLLFRDLLIFLLLVRSAQALPRQATAVEVHEHISEGLQIITTTLLDTQMRVDARVPRCPRQILVLPVRNMLVCLGIAILLCKPKIDDIDLVCFLAETHQKVVRLDITMNEALRVHEFDTAEHLLREHKNCLQTEFARAKIEEILQAWPQEIDNHHVVVSLDSIPAHIRKTHAALQDLENFGLIKKLRMLALHAFEFDGHLLGCGNIGAKKDVSKRAAPDLPSQPVLVSYAQLHFPKRC
mmetsp:Transcript_16937/g.33938  ORF Transcript_16937/g.33938 Transcript_16937/m.33938 type:complete len:319 (+) Transcript_16937:608-1564(+)